MQRCGAFATRSLQWAAGRRAVVRLRWARVWCYSSKGKSRAFAAGATENRKLDTTRRRRRGRGIPKDGMSLVDFSPQGAAPTLGTSIAATSPEPSTSALVDSISDNLSADLPVLPTGAEQSMQANQLSFYIQTYGCQMNVSDSEIVRSIMLGAGYEEVDQPVTADVILVNTCAIRENAEQRVRARLADFKGIKRRQRLGIKQGIESVSLGGEGSPLEAATSGGGKKSPLAPPPGGDEAVVGVLGCMAERLKTKLLEQEGAVDLIAGPDAYRDLPSLVAKVREGRRQGAEDPRASNTQLSLSETYADIAPVRGSDGAVSSFVSISRGCNNMCSFCVVPFTRGRERSRPVATIEGEVRSLADRGYKEVVLLGQNVNSYHDAHGETDSRWEAVAGAGAGYETARGFGNMFRLRGGGGGVRFAELLDRVARAAPEMRVRFTSPHPKDFPRAVLEAVRQNPNVCNSLHMPLQSGSSAVLQRMRRFYTRETFQDLCDEARAAIPGVALSTDVIAGFCGETQADHRQTVEVLQREQFDQGFLFAYSLRDRTHAARKYKDDVPEETKAKRLEELIRVFLQGASRRFSERLGKVEVVLVESQSRRSLGQRDGQHGTGQLWQGRTDGNRRAVFPGLPPSLQPGGRSSGPGPLPLDVALEAGLMEVENRLVEAMGGGQLGAQVLPRGGTEQLWAGVPDEVWGSVAGNSGIDGDPGFSEGDFVAVVPIRSNAKTLHCLPLCVVPGGAAADVQTAGVAQLGSFLDQCFPRLDDADSDAN